MEEEGEDVGLEGWEKPMWRWVKVLEDANPGYFGC